MTVYLMGHGFVVPDFPKITDLPDGFDLKFYVPQGVIKEKFYADYGETEKTQEEYVNLVDLSLYDGSRSPYYIWNDGEAIADVVGVEADIKNKERECRGVQVVNEQIDEHLLHSSTFMQLNEDLKKGLKRNAKTGVLTKNLTALTTLKEYPFVIYQVMNVIFESDTPPSRANPHQYIVTPAWKPLGQEDPTDDTVYRLSWLITKIFELKQELRIPEEEEVHICWLACRYALKGRNNAECLHSFENPETSVLDDKPSKTGTTCKIKDIYPRVL